MHTLPILTPYTPTNQPAASLSETHPLPSKVHDVASTSDAAVHLDRVTQPPTFLRSLNTKTTPRLHRTRKYAKHTTRQPFTIFSPRVGLQTARTRGPQTPSSPPRTAAFFAPESTRRLPLLGGYRRTEGGKARARRSWPGDFFSTQN